MSKTTQDFQQELAQLFCKAGENQFMARVYRKGLEDINNELNTLNQKIEKVQKDFRTFMASNSQAVAGIPASAAPAAEAVKAALDQPTVPEVSGANTPTQTA